MAEEKSNQRLKNIIEAALLAAGEPLSRARLSSLFAEDDVPPATEISKALQELAEDCEERGVELREVASGYRLQVKPELQEWVARLWTEKPATYSRAMLETLSLIAYRQPITRGEIESVRGVSLSSSIIRTLQERDWIRIVGHRDVPGKPALFGTTKEFLDYFNLKTLDQLPTLSEIKDMDSLEPELEFEPGEDSPGDSEDVVDAVDSDEAEQPAPADEEDSSEENETVPESDDSALDIDDEEPGETDEFEDELDDGDDDANEPEDEPAPENKA